MISIVRQKKKKKNWPKILIYDSVTTVFLLAQIVITETLLVHFFSRLLFQTNIYLIIRLYAHIKRLIVCGLNNI